MTSSKSTDKTKTKKVEEIYKKKSHHEHILDESDSYIGSKDTFTESIFIINDTNHIYKKEIEYTPGLYKIIDEIIVNARDHFIRDKTCNTIKVNISKDAKTISVWNNGNGIPVEMHKEQKIYVPELIFGHLLTSSNYYEKGKIVGGKNGYGAKLTNIFSTEFIVETVDSKNKKRYHQRFENNMYKIHEPDITSVSGKCESYTKITFTPDFKRFNLDELDPDMLALIKKRVYDLAACTDKSVKVYYNDEQICVNTFQNYINLYYDTATLPSEIVYEEINERWKVGVLYDTHSGYRQISFVNGISTFHGGTHVNYIVDQIIKELVAYIKKKDKQINVKPQYIRDNLTIFIDCIIEDPNFESQTKELLKKKVSDFGSKCVLSEKFIQRIIKTGICDEVMKTAENKDNIALKKVGGTKTDRIRDIPKLEDAEEAGKRQAYKCRLILTEGDSAKKFAVDGISHVGNKYYGVFPLRGKLLNVREAKPKKIQNNKEIVSIMKIMGLKIKTDKKGNIIKSFAEIKKLRYGGIVILTDQDYDGSHIKGLIINFMYHFWPNLLKCDGFVQTIITPIIKVFKGTQSKSFDTITAFKEWKEKEDSKGWKTKYYKGLGTSSKQDAIEVFDKLDKRMIDYVWDLNVKQNVDGTDDVDDSSSTHADVPMTDAAIATALEADTKHTCYDAIDLAFNKKRSDDRKKWVQDLDEQQVIDYDKCKKISYKMFVDDDLRHFSHYDVKRSIPAIDGFKPSQRKVLFGCFKHPKLRNLTKREEIKVSQLAGYIAEHTEYHHGETNLFGTIIKMAQDFRGANNINLLMPNGNFGSFRAKGTDFAAPRYIFTEINPLTFKLFRREDERIYTYCMEETKKVEPELYAPIIPTILINGKIGIGTGFSTNIPMFNPIDICNNVLALIDKKKQSTIKPWYRGFKGTIEEISKKKFKSHGIYHNDEDTITITELPIGTCTDEYKEFLEELQIDTKNPTPKQIVESYKTNPDNTEVHITIQLRAGLLQDLIKSGELTKRLKLESNINLTNMWLFDATGKLKLYGSAKEIIQDFYDFRYQMYVLRKKHYTKILENRYNIFKYKKMFIEYYLEGRIVINKTKSEENVMMQLEKLKFPKLATNVDNDVDNDDDDNEEDGDNKLDVVGKYKKSFEYLTSMKLFSLTKNRIEELESELAKVEAEFETYKNTTVEQLWKNEINEFIDSYKEYLVAQSNVDSKTDKGSKTKKAAKKIKN